MRILLIEDNPGDVELLRLGFEESFEERGRHLIFDVRMDGRSGMTALTDAAQRATPPYQLVVLDLNLPVYSGFDLLAFIKQHERLRNLPTVVLTSSNRPAERARARALDADGYFLKPSSFEGYVALVGSLGQYLVPHARG